MEVLGGSWHEMAALGSSRRFWAVLGSSGRFSAVLGNCLFKPLTNLTNRLICVLLFFLASTVGKLKKTGGSGGSEETTFAFSDLEKS